MPVCASVCACVDPSSPIYDNNKNRVWDEDKKEEKNSTTFKLIIRKRRRWSRRWKNINRDNNNNNSRSNIIAKCVVMRTEASKTHTLPIIYFIFIQTDTHTHTLPSHTHTHAHLVNESIPSWMSKMVGRIQSYFHMSPPKAISVAKLKNYD